MAMGSPYRVFDAMNSYTGRGRNGSQRAPATSGSGKAHSASRLSMAFIMMRTASSVSMMNGVGCLGLAFIGVRTKPGQIVVTETEVSRKSTRRLSRNVDSAAFDAE